MAAGLGFKTFNTGDILSASDVNGYLMQGVLVFADATARDAAITSPQEGQFAYTKDTNGLWYYSGSAWVASGATGDIEGVTAGTGISGGGTSGTVTITNSMATAIDAKGDLVAGTGADTFARLAVGANDTVLTADSSTATGLKWATAGGTTFPTFRAYRGTDQTIGSATWTKVSLNTEVWDTNNNFDPTTNFRFTPTVSGYYQINALAYIYNNAGNNGNYNMSVYKNGAQYATWQALNDTGYQLALSTLVYFNGTTDYIELYARQTGSGNGTVSAGPVDNYMDGIGIRS